MHKNEILARLAESQQMRLNKADAVLEAFIEHITNALARGESVSVMGFGSFTVKSRSARSGRHPQTGDPIDIPASSQVVFKAGKQFKLSIQA